MYRYISQVLYGMKILQLLLVVLVVVVVVVVVVVFVIGVVVIIIIIIIIIMHSSDKHLKAFMNYPSSCLVCILPWN